MARQAGVSFDDAKTNTRPERTRITDLITLFKWPERKWVTVRFYPELHSYATGWVKSKTKDGKAVKFPAVLRSYDPATMEFDSTIYDPWYELYLAEKDVKQDERMIQVSKKFYGNMIVRKLQNGKPEKPSKPTPEEKESGFKEKDSETWTCWSAFALPPGAIGKIKELKGLNVVESRKTGKSREYAVTDLDFGCDVKVYFDPDKDPASQYTFQLGERTAITDEELADLRWDTSNLEPNIPDEKTVRADYEQWAKRNNRRPVAAPVGDDDDDGFGTSSKRGSKRRDDSDEDEVEEIRSSGKRRAAEPEDDGFDDEPPKRGGKRSAEPEDDDAEPPKRGRRAAAQSDDDLDDAEPPKRGRRTAEPEDDDLDDVPARGKRRAAPADDDGFDDEPPKRSSGKRAAPADDDGFDDEPPKRGGKRSAPKDDDDDLDSVSADDPDDAPFDEDEPPKRRRR